MLIRRFLLVNDLFSALVTLSGQGYIQSKFAQECTLCHSIINKEGLALLKFTRNLVLDDKAAADIEAYGPGVYLA